MKLLQELSEARHVEIERLGAYIVQAESRLRAVQESRTWRIVEEYNSFRRALWRLRARDRAESGRAARSVTRTPHISVMTPVWNTDPRLLALCVESVLDQRYGNWELCLADDGSTRPETLAMLQRLGGVDPRVRVSFGHVHSGISATQNRALGMARVSWSRLLDHDDVLDPHALGAVAEVALRHPDADVIYTDEDQIDTGGNRLSVIYKPAWSPELLLACAYFNHLTVYRRSLVDALGGFREDYDLAQDWNLALRATAVTDRVHHVAQVLYHWRRTPGSAGNFSPHGPAWRRRCHADHVLERFGPEAVSEPVWIDGFFWTMRPIRGRPLVSVVIPTVGTRQRLRGATETLVLNCLRSILSRTDYPEFEVVVVVDPRTPRTVRSALAAIGSNRVRMVDAEGPFNYSAARQPRCPHRARRTPGPAQRRHRGDQE